MQRHALLRQRPTAMIPGQNPADEFLGVRAIQEDISCCGEFIAADSFGSGDCFPS
jgi:hypothetical protein